MGRRGKVEGLPEDVRRWLERALMDSGFSGYDALKEMLAERGYVMSKSAIHRYGSKIERRFATIKASTEAARLLTAEIPRLPGGSPPGALPPLPPAATTLRDMDFPSPLGMSSPQSTTSWSMATRPTSGRIAPPIATDARLDASRGMPSA